MESGKILNFFESWATSLSYTFQLYFDFSGYCDMAIGLGLLFGIMLPINFNSPYKALNIADFWRRWHITLGRFLRDYLYIPLGGNRLGKWLTLRNLFVVAFLSGIWHGAGFGFIIWGSLHGAAMVIHRVYSGFVEQWRFRESRIYKIFCWFLTFNFVNLSWIFFRSENLSGAINLLKGMFGIVWVELPEKAWRMPTLLKGIEGKEDTLVFLVLSFIVVLLCSNSIQKLETFRLDFKNMIIATLCLYISLFTMAVTPYVEFIYFNF